MTFVCLSLLESTLNGSLNDSAPKRYFLYFDTDRPERDRDFILIIKQALAEAN